MQLPLPSTKHAFSLVELSIVLVILGLLVGGVLAGQSLIRAAELRSVATEYSRYVAATQSFRDKYFALPGDMTNATAFWGKNTTYCNSASGSAGTPGTCNGDGSGGVEATGCCASPASHERFNYWQHLALAGLVEGTFTGISGAGGFFEAVIGSNVPQSRLANAGWTVSFMSGTNNGHSASFTTVQWGNYLTFGAAMALNSTQAPALRGEEAWNIDTKLDDGMPGTGKVIGYNTAACATGSTAAAAYFLTNNQIRCALMFPQAF